MKERVPATLDGLFSAARRDAPAPSTLSRLAEETARSTASTPSRAISSLAALIRPRTAVVVVAASVAAFGVFATTRALDDSSPPAVTALEGDMRAEAASATSPEPAAVATNHAPEIPTIDVRSLPTTKTAPEMRRPLAENAKVAPDEEMSEGALLHRAHAAISTDPQKALALTVEHARRFPGGMLTQEREVIAIEALARSKRADETRARAARFFATYPGSAYRSRVDEALGASASTASPEGAR